MNKLFFLACLVVAIYTSGIFDTAGQDNGNAPPPLLNDMTLNYRAITTLGEHELFNQKMFTFKQHSGDGFDCIIKQASDNIDLHISEILKVNGFFIPTDSKYTLTVESYPIWLPVDKLANDDINGHDISQTRWNNQNAFKVILLNITGGATRYYSQQDGVLLGVTRKTKKTFQKIILTNRT